MKAEELLPKLLKDLSNGIAISIKDIANKNNLSNDSIKVPLRNIRDNFFPNCYKYDGSSRKWVVTEPGFLKKTLLKPEEAVVLNAILRNKNSQGKSLEKWNTKIVENYIKRTSSFIFKQHISENITQDMEQLFAQIHSAIDEKKKIRFKMYDTYRVVFPYKVIYIEYYWYLLGYEDSCEREDAKTKRTKSFSMSKIKGLELLDEKFHYDFNYIDDKLENIMNAYFRLDAPQLTVELLVSKRFTEYIDRATFFSAWKKIDYMETINNVEYIRYEVKITDPEFREIIPTILQYMPNIIVESPKELSDKLQSMLNDYQNIY